MVWLNILQAAALSAIFATQVDAAPASAPAPVEPRDWFVNCYPHGTLFDDAGGRAAVVNAVNHLCHNGGPFQYTYFKPYSESPAPAHQCTNLDMLHSAVWEITNLNENQGFTLQPDDCAKWLTEIYDQCGRGGELIVSGWKYRADPNIACDIDN